MFKNVWVKRILQAILIIGAGFILLNFTFLFDFVFQGFLKFVFYPNNDAMNMVGWLAPFQHILFMVLIGFISWLVLRTKWPVLLKAIYLAVPVAVALVTVGIATYRWPIATYSISVVLVLGTLYWFWRTKQPWQYFLAVIWVAITLLIMTLTGAEI